MVGLIVDSRSFPLLPIRSLSQKDFWLQVDSQKPILAKLSHQKVWAETFAPHLDFDPSLDPWTLLQNFTTPLILNFASRAHLQGLREFGLLESEMPIYSDFAKKVEQTTGWKIEHCERQLESLEYFSLIARKILPCNSALRPSSGVLCGNSPDFWHEAIGHIAPFIDPKVSEFYQHCGQLYVDLVEQGQFDQAYRLERVLWTILEYGFLNEEGTTKAFGAALTGSFVALTKWQIGKWSTQKFTVDSVLESKFYDLTPARDSEGRVLFFEMESLSSALLEIDRAFRKNEL